MKSKDQLVGVVGQTTVCSTHIDTPHAGVITHHRSAGEDRRRVLKGRECALQQIDQLRCNIPYPLPNLTANG